MIWEVSGDSWEVVLSDSCGLSECVLAVFSGVPVVTQVSVSPPVRSSLLTLIVRL